MQKGNYYPWQSTLPPFNGEDVYLDEDDSFDLLIWRRGPINVLLTFGFSREQVPSWAEVEPVIKKIFREYAKCEGVELRFRRFLWKAAIEK